MDIMENVKYQTMKDGVNLYLDASIGHRTKMPFPRRRN